MTAVAPITSNRQMMRSPLCCPCAQKSGRMPRPCAKRRLAVYSGRELQASDTAMVLKVRYLLMAERQETLSLSHRPRKESCNRELRKTSRRVQYTGPNSDRPMFDVRHSSWQFYSDRLV